MGTIAVFENFLIVVFAADFREKRRHLHIIQKIGRNRKLVAKIWLEKEDKKEITKDYSDGIKEKKLNAIIKRMEERFEEINAQIDEVFSGNKVTIIRIKNRCAK